MGMKHIQAHQCQKFQRPYRENLILQSGSIGSLTSLDGVVHLDRPGFFEELLVTYYPEYPVNPIK
jgi:hypothetical protein